MEKERTRLYNEFKKLVNKTLMFVFIDLITLTKLKSLCLVIGITSLFGGSGFFAYSLVK